MVDALVLLKCIKCKQPTLFRLRDEDGDRRAAGTHCRECDGGGERRVEDALVEKQAVHVPVQLERVDDDG